MNELLSIGCPHCGSVLSIKNMPGIENKTVTCPVCHQKSRIRDCKRFQKHNNEDEPTETLYKSSTNLIIGVLKNTFTKQTWQLKTGRNVIGRKASTNLADIVIPTEDKRLSRDHIVIDVRETSTDGYVHLLSLAKERVNKTFVGETELEYGDCIKLKEGTVITLPGVKLIFEIPDNDITEIENLTI